MDSRALERVEKVLGKQTLEEMQKLLPEELKMTVVQATTAMRDAKAERDANPKYKEAKQAVSDLGAGLREVNKRQNAKVAYALYLLDPKDAEDAKADDKDAGAALERLKANKPAPALDDAALGPDPTPKGAMAQAFAASAKGSGKKTGSGRRGMIRT